MTAMDRTEEFRKAVLQNRKKVSSKQSHPILKKTKPKSDFENKAKKILLTITQLKILLQDNRKTYANFQHMFASNDSMTDQERDGLERSAEEIIKTCSETIKTLGHQVNHDSTKHIDIHRSLVIEFLQKYLKFVCKIYSELKAIRVKKVVDKKVISRLHNPKLASNPAPSASTINTKSNFVYDEDYSEISDNEENQFAQENVQLMKEFNTMVDEVKSIEGKVVEIARLQEVFAEQVLHQEETINVVADKVAESTENIVDGNEEIREAIKNNAGFRVWILFFIVMCSFSLLFLEWYS